MGTVHIESDKDDIASVVLMPGDPKRCEYIAKNYLKDYKLVNSIRGMTAYTGLYDDVRVTLFPSGMGIPSMGIYSYELFKFYDVKKIIRIGTSGANKEDVKLMDIILATSSYSLSTFANLFEDFDEKEIASSKNLNDKIISVAKSMDIDLKVGRIITSDVFNPYVDDINMYNIHYEGVSSLASEMESFALFFMANKFKRDATTLLTVVDSQYDERKISSIDREKNLNMMIELALNSLKN